MAYLMFVMGFWYTLLVFPGLYSNCDGPAFRLLCLWVPTFQSARFVLVWACVYSHMLVTLRKVWARVATLKTAGGRACASGSWACSHIRIVLVLSKCGFHRGVELCRPSQEWNILSSNDKSRCDATKLYSGNWWVYWAFLKSKDYSSGCI